MYNTDVSFDGAFIIMWQYQFPGTGTLLLKHSKLLYSILSLVHNIKCVKNPGTNLKLRDKKGKGREAVWFICHIQLRCSGAAFKGSKIKAASKRNGQYF